MRRLIRKIVPNFQKISDSIASYQRPRFSCRQRPRTLDLEVYVPGVEEDAVELAVDRDELVVTARKSLGVRTNWPAAGFEAVQHDYQLRVQLPDAVDSKSIWAVLKHGILTVHLRTTSAHAPLDLQVA